MLRDGGGLASAAFGLDGAGAGECGQRAGRQRHSQETQMCDEIMTLRGQWIGLGPVANTVEDDRAGDRHGKG
ncbi:Uncharacterised protein [Mycobacteroides abscessus subsp. massiliense]|nr:Uncharacterised protein [Mycobacteroides abscessus subsp. massiliense]